VAALAVAALLVLPASPGAAQQTSGIPVNPDAWQIPPTAATEENPVALDEGVLKKGLGIYRDKCQRCHGADGMGRGPEADPNRPAGDLTDFSRARANPDGVMFYRIWNGRKNPGMPAFKTDMSRDDVWTVIHYVKTLRR
jgi:mono/diheme cytochrome c family protein